MRGRRKTASRSQLPSRQVEHAIYLFFFAISGTAGSRAPKPPGQAEFSGFGPYTHCPPRSRPGPRDWPEPTCGRRVLIRYLSRWPAESFHEPVTGVLSFIPAALACGTAPRVGGLRLGDGDLVALRAEGQLALGRRAFYLRTRQGPGESRPTITLGCGHPTRELFPVDHAASPLDGTTKRIDLTIRAQSPSISSP